MNAPLLYVYDLIFPSFIVVSLPIIINTATYGEQAYSYASTKLWNALVPDYYIKSCDTVSTFKTALKTYLYKEIVSFNILIL